MPIQNLFSSLLYLTTIIIFILITFSLASYDEDEQFFKCSKPFRCGNFFKEIKYPFWGGDRPQECGLPEFELRCQQNNYFTIDIGSQTFRVLRIDESNLTFIIARNDLWNDICPEKYENTDLTGDATFRYGRDVERLNLSYFCPFHPDFPLRNIYTCGTDGNNNTGFLADQSFSSIGSQLPACRLNITVPVLESALEEFRSNTAMTLQELLNQGFQVEYSKNSNCSACTRSGGVCWSGINSERPMCLCRDGPREYICPGNGGSKFVGGRKIAIALGAAAFSAIIVCLIWCCKYKECLGGSILPICKGKAIDDQNLEAIIEQYGSLTPRRYSYSDIKKMTNSFRDKLGQGGYGDVYKGYLPNNLPVAVKILKATKGNGEEFINEVASISRTSHVNVVTLLGFCIDGQKRALIYEYLSNGSLEKYIHKESDAQLGLERLYEIAIGIAQGLEYLHRGCNTRILHFDIKPHNILLDEDFCPKISDFGLAKLCTRKESIVSMLVARGTIGYIAPEVFCRNFGGVSYKADVYSYGMMILEMVGGRRNAVNVEMSRSSEAYFPRWIYQRVMLDEDLKLQQDHVMTKAENEIARKMIIVGLWCIQTDPSLRPSMSKVIDMLEGSLKDLELPPKPFLCSPSRSPDRVALAVRVLPSETISACPSRSAVSSYRT